MAGWNSLNGLIRLGSYLLRYMWLKSIIYLFRIKSVEYNNKEDKKHARAHKSTHTLPVWGSLNHSRRKACSYCSEKASKCVGRRWFWHLYMKTAIILHYLVNKPLRAAGMSSPCTAIFISVTRLDEDDVRDIGKHDFRSVLSHAMLANANHLKGELSTTSLLGSSVHLRGKHTAKKILGIKDWGSYFFFLVIRLLEWHLVQRNVDNK